MATPFLISLRKIFDGFTISVYSRSYVSEVFRRSSAVDELVINDSRNPFKIYTVLRGSRPAKGWRYAFVLPNSFASAVAAFLSGAEERVGYRAEMRDWLLSKPLDGGMRRDIHLSEVYMNILKSAVDIDVEKVPAPVVVPPYNWRNMAERFTGVADYFVVAPGAAYGDAKKWPLEYFRDAAVKISKGTGLPVVIVGSAAERRMVEDAFSGFRHKWIDLTGKTSVEELMSVVRGASLLIGNDSGVSHISSAMGIPTVSIFGSSTPVWTAPRGPLSRFIYKGLPCSPCFKKECPNGDPRCLKEITVEEVLEVSLKLLRDKERMNEKGL